MKLFTRWIASLLGLILFFYSGSDVVKAFADSLAASKTTVLQNDFIKISVDNASGRFGIRTVDGQPIRKKDQNVSLLFQGDDPETSFTTFKIDGTDYIFGNPYKFGVDFFSETTPPVIVSNANGTKQIETVWTIKDVRIKQILMLYTDASDKVNAGNVDIRYEVLNASGRDVQLGGRILLDTMVGGNDGPAFQIGTAYEQPLTVERELVHDPVKELGVAPADEAYYKLPPYWIMKDKLGLNDPSATDVMAYGFNNFAEQNINIVDKMIVGHWNGLANTKWDYRPNGNLDFTTDTNDYGTADSAVAFYWNPDKLANNAVQSFETVYGLGELIAPDKVFSIRYLDTPLQLATNDDGSAYADEGIFDINAEVENLAAFNMAQSQIDVKLALDDGLSFVQLDDQGRIVRGSDGSALTETARSKKLTFRKTATPEESEQGIIPKYKPGDTVTATFKVKAKGRPWPTTQQYLMTASSPETEKTLEGQKDETIKAQYESTKSSFILLPAVGTAVPTTAYGLTPKEAYASDVKYITVNMTNIDAYNPGNDAADPNFDLFLVNAETGDRYKVPVKSSVIVQPTDDGFSGDMRITYRGGDQVDENGAPIEGKTGLGPELPLGAYKVEIDYKGDTGGNADISSMYSLTTSRTFAVTDNEATRIRQAELMAVYKTAVDVRSVSPSTGGDRLDEINDAFPEAEQFKDGAALYNGMVSYRTARALIGAASKATDPGFDTSGFLDDEALEEFPAYQYKLFDSEEDFEAFFDEEEHPEREMLVSIRGMIKEAGAGDDVQVVVDTKTEPAIINDAVAYRGKDMVFVRGKLDVFNLSSVAGYNEMPFLDTLFVKGDGTLSIASSGFVFHKGEWTLDFFNGFDKSLGDGYTVDGEEMPESEGNPADSSLNGSLQWAAGALNDQLNPLRQASIDLVYFNKHSLFATPTFSLNGFSIAFNDFVLRPEGVSFGGAISLKVLSAEIRNVIFNDKGFVGIDAGLKFNLNENLGLVAPSEEEDDEEEDAKPSSAGGGAAAAALAGTGGSVEKEGPEKPSGEINIVHFVQPVEGVSNQYGLKFDAQLKNMVGISAEIAFKQVDDGRVLPDVIAFGAELPPPGIPIAGAINLTAIRGAVRELADTIAGGTKEDPFPLTLQAGVGLRFGVAPAYFFGDIDLTLKRTGIALEGTLDYSAEAEPEDDQLLKMITMALIEAQWTSPWFVHLAAEVDIGGWNLIVGKVGIFVGQNLEKHRTDFEGYIGAKVQIPESVPVVGGMPLASVFFGLNNDKIWGSVGILFISLGITYYWGGGVEFGTSGNRPPDGFADLLVNDPVHGPSMMVIGQGMKTVATSWVQAERETQPVTYRAVSEGVQILDNGAMDIGVGGIGVSNNGRVHIVPMSGVSGNAIIEMEYTDKTMPSFTLKDPSGKPYPVVFDNTNTNPNANAFTQIISAKASSDQVDHRKAYIILPQDKIKNGGSWTLTAQSPVETRLINVPTTPQLKQVSLTKSASDANVFTAGWTVSNAKPGDTIDLYLTKDAVTGGTAKLANGEDVLNPGDPGMLIAQGLPVGSAGSGGTASGSKAIDVSKIGMLGDEEDIRGLLQQGDYYLRAELKSDSAYGTKTSPEKFSLVDPLAPEKVSDVKIEPAGDGYFSLSFKPAAKQQGQEKFEHDYVFSALQTVNGKLEPYANYGDTLFTENELKEHWNAKTGRYEGILLGGWAATTNDNKIDESSLAGQLPDEAKIRYSGLQVGQKYAIGVEAAVKPDKTADKNENYHFAERVDSANTLLPVPAKPKLAQSAAFAAAAPKIEITTRDTKAQSLALYSDQPDIEVEAFNDGQPVGKTTLSNDGSGSHGTLKLDPFATDGTYGIELRATNTKTHDSSVKMLYLTVDTIAPMLYLSEPVTGDRTDGGKIRFAGQTTAGDSIEVLENGKATRLTVGDDGKFAGEVAVNSQEPTVELTVQARDEAGNANHAVIEVTNDGFEAPEAIAIERAGTTGGGDEVLGLKPGDSQKLQVKLLLPQGKGGDGKPTFGEVQADAAKVTYTVLQGDSVELADDGTIKALSVGASLIQASYEAAEGVTLQAMKAVSVDVPEPSALGRLTAGTSQITGDGARIKLTVANPGEMLGYQLVYRTYANPSEAAIPSLGDDIGDWAFLPQDGNVAVKSGSVVVAAKRTSSGKKAVAASDKLTAQTWQPPFGGGMIGGGIGGDIGVPGEDGPAFSLNGEPFDAERSDDGRLTARIAAKDIGDGNSDIAVASRDASAKGFTFRFDREAVQQAADAGRRIVIDVPPGSLTLTPAMLRGMDKELEVSIDPNDGASRAAFGPIAAEADATLLASGDGATFRANIPAAVWRSCAAVRIPVPSGIKPGDITAVVLRGTDGSWTTLPWTLDAAGSAYVNVKLTGPGSVAFIGKHASFADVKSGSWAKPAIDQAAAKLLVMGRSADVFAPDSSITRAEYPTLLLRAAGLMTQQAEASYVDVKPADWYYRSVAIASQLGVAAGTGDGGYGPKATISRIEAMTMAGRLLGAIGRGGEMTDAEAGKLLSAFQDGSSVPEWARLPVALCIREGLVTGDDARIKPDDRLTRAQAAAIALRLDAWITEQQ
ncbi:S-layer homology domain-containing protein [Paenibacillus glycinis]|uniref:SLH domain-containing protein n=1 Tax=Paenibacillus glycinis TaxID=2697035 RepID=A0ABW9XXA5_9BACL|nr:S-layer homology domain-containing protein [Paenibacillus glycinis]NBD27274.1 hypothetical protein [Paenibacillus glycinis]